MVQHQKKKKPYQKSTCIKCLFRYQLTKLGDVGNIKSLHEFGPNLRPQAIAKHNSNILKFSNNSRIFFQNHLQEGRGEFAKRWHWADFSRCRIDVETIVGIEPAEFFTYDLLNRRQKVRVRQSFQRLFDT